MSVNKIKFIKNIVNMTDDVIRMYNMNGSIKSFRCCFGEPLYHVAKNYAGMEILPFCYVLEQDRYEELRKTDRGLDDIAYVSFKAIGRGGATISYLVWGKDPSVSLRLR